MPRTQHRFLASALASSLAFAPSMAAAAPVTVKISVRAPFVSSSLGADKLGSVENHGLTPFNKNFEIPYATLEKEIDKAIDDLIPNKVSGVEVCTDPCPDVTWSVTLNPNFKFTKKNQPTLKQLGASGESKVRVELKTAARLDLKAHVKAETWFDTVETDVGVFVVVGLTAQVDVSLWPDLKANKPGSNENGVKLEFELIDTDIDLNIDGQVAGLGFKWGTIIGLSPIGVLAGGPILGPILAIIGDAAADAATEEIGRIFDEKVAEAFKAQTDNLEDMANEYINPLIAQANDLKDDVLDTPIPGVGKTIDQLEDDLGADLKLHTVASTSSVHSAAIMRFSSSASGGKVFGKVRVPKKVCQYAKINIGGFKATMPMGLKDSNEDLKAKVGTKCSTALAEKFGRKSFLGANPKNVLGTSAQDLPNWSGTVGTVTYEGNVSETADWYECAYELTSLPKAAILEIDAGELSSRGIGVDRRVMEVTAAGKSLVFDNELKPLPMSGGNSSLVIGGKGECGGGSSSGGLTPNKMKELKDLLDPEKCPQCGVKKIKDHEIYEFTNPEAFLDTKFGQELEAQIKKAKGNTLKPGATKPTVKPGMNLPKMNPQTKPGAAAGPATKAKTGPAVGQ
jgi:hypothetical protein